MAPVARTSRTARRALDVEQLTVGFTGLETVESPIHELAVDTMRQIVSIRMPDSLVARVETAAAARGVSPSSLMRALIAAGLDRSYAAVTETDLTGELASLRRAVERIAAQLAAESTE